MAFGMSARRYALLIVFALVVKVCVAGTPREVPNVFTPNGDGKNDFFELEASQPLTLMVFNRNGVLVYEARGKRILWDGRDELGRELGDGVYFYHLEDPSGEYKPLRGPLCISRAQTRNDG